MYACEPNGKKTKKYDKKRAKKSIAANTQYYCLLSTTGFLCDFLGAMVFSSYTHSNTPFALVPAFSFWISRLLVCVCVCVWGFFAIRKRIFPYNFMLKTKKKPYKTMLSSLQLTYKCIQKSRKESRIWNIQLRFHHIHSPDKEEK